LGSGQEIAFGRLTISAPEILNETHDVAAFSSGKPALDDWLKKRALVNQQRGYTLVVIVHDAGRVVGYYGLAPTAVMPDRMPRSIRGGQPPNPVPCFLLGQLATDLDWAGKGIGTGLLRDALVRCVAGSRLIGGRAIVVNALDDEAARFWMRRGFLPSRDDPLTLYRSIADIAASLAAAGISIP
jgi:GNAT superfamily N-acetyltransferase